MCYNGLVKPIRVKQKTLHFSHCVNEVQLNIRLSTVVWRNAVRLLFYIGVSYYKLKCTPRSISRAVAFTATPQTPVSRSCSLHGQRMTAAALERHSAVTSHPAIRFRQSCWRRSSPAQSGSSHTMPHSSGCASRSICRGISPVSIFSQAYSSPRKTGSARWSWQGR